MLKRWRVSFDPATEYFRLRHLWVLLPGLPLQYWTEKALAAIGNELGRFISLDDSHLKGSDRNMARILVEMDIHAGLPETLDIIWRGRTMTQRLDYLGIPFRCTSCRRTGHLRRDCTGETEEEESEASYLRKLSREDSPGVDSFVATTDDFMDIGDWSSRLWTHSLVSLSCIVLLFILPYLLGKGIIWTHL
jgi:hypothetical protein